MSIVTSGREVEKMLPVCIDFKVKYTCIYNFAPNLFLV